MADSPSKLLVDHEGAPRDRIVGIETEYGLYCRDRNNSPNSRMAQELACYTFELKKHEQFEESGERIYLDVGFHPELSTAEDTSFLGAAYRVLSGHIKMGKRYGEAPEILATRGRDLEIGRVDLVANTCSLNGNSWSSHGNELASRGLKPKDYIDAKAAHHLSRIVWSGVGKPAARRDGKYKFVVSEKAEHIWDVANNQDTRDRPLVHLRDEPHADPQKYRRVHDVSGESNVSPFAIALRHASGSIVLRACELGVDFSDLLPENPVAAMREISSDPTLKRTVRLSDGRQVNGVQLQQDIAERSIKAATDADYLTDQEKLWSEKWVKVLDDLSIDPQSCIRRVDWVLKQNLIDRELNAKQDNGQSDVMVAWAKAVDYHRVLPQEGKGLQFLRKGFFDDSPSPEVLDTGLPLPDTRAKVRVEIVRQFKQAGHKIHVDWGAILPVGYPHRLIMPEPHDSVITDDDQGVIRKFITRLDQGIDTVFV